MLAAPIYLIALLPFPLFYLLSDFLFLLGYYIIGYRKKVIHQNLKNAFPEKTEAEITAIGRKYYRHMIDLFLETFKVLVMTPKQLQKRQRFDESISIPQEFAAKKQSVIYVLGHFGNWEWSGQSFQVKHIMQLDVLYHPIKNKFFDWLTYKIRNRFGMYPIPMQVSVKEMIRRRDKAAGTAFLADQTPSNKDASHWMTFLNQDTPVFAGTEKIAKKLNLPVVFIHVKKLKRGYYETAFEIITASPKDTPENWITERHTQMLEQDILKQPEIWLWSHRRWKHKRPATVVA